MAINAIARGVQEPVVLLPEADHNPTIEKVGQVYAYTAAGFGASFLSATLFAATGFAEKLVTLLAGTSVWATGLGLLAVGVGLVAGICFTPKESSVLRNGLFGLFTVYQGLILSPLVLINAPVFAVSALATVGVVGGLGVLALKMQTQFERFEKVMMVAFGALAALSFASLFLSGAAAAIAHPVCLVGGLALFGAYVIYDTQKIRQEIERNPDNFDVLTHTMTLYLDSINIFTQIYQLLNNRSDNN